MNPEDQPKVNITELQRHAEVFGVKRAAALDLYAALLAGARSTRAVRKLSMHDLRVMTLAAKERIMALAKRIEDGCCECTDGQVWRPTKPSDPQHHVNFGKFGEVWEPCRCSCHKHETTRPEPLAVHRTEIEMDTAEYERMRKALGEEWEWRGLVRFREE